MSFPLQSTSLPLGAYVLSLSSLRDCIAAAASSPSDAIHLLDNSNLQHISTLSGHHGGITTIRAVSTLGSSTGTDILLSSGQDGRVNAWDHRSNKIAIQMNNLTNAGILSLDVSPNGQTVAAGTELTGDESSILYWDPRKPSVPVYSHSSTHSDDITTIQFNTATSALLSSSTDGLLSISNPSQTDEDEAVLHVGNWGTSIAQTGWTQNGIWAASDMETFSLWSNELDKSFDFNLRDLKQHLLLNNDISWDPDYLISCQESVDLQNLLLFVGSNSGAFSILSLKPTSAPKWTLERLYPSHHDGIVRSVLYDERSGRLLTGGEDSKIHLWTHPLPNSTSARKRDFDDIDMQIDDHDEGNKKLRRD